MTRISSRFLSDDTSCAAGLYWPNTANSNGPHPVIVMAHGFAGQRNFRLPAFAKHFRAAGFAVLIFDYRTFGDSDGTPRQYINPWRQLVDWRAAIQHVRQLDRVDHRRIILWGSSFSGGHVVSIASEDHAIAGVIAQVPFVSGLATIQQLAIKDLLRMSLAGFGDLLTAFVGLGPLTLPVVNASGKRALLNTEESYPGYQRLINNDPNWRNAVPARVALQLPFYNPLFKAQRIQCPTLVVAAQSDSLIPIHLVRRLADRIPTAQLEVLQANHFDPYFDEVFESNISRQLNFLRLWQ